MAIRREWTTTAEREVLRDALVFYADELDRRTRRTRSERTRAECRWRKYQVQQLLRDIGE